MTYPLGKVSLKLGEGFIYAEKSNCLVSHSLSSSENSSILSSLNMTKHVLYFEIELLKQFKQGHDRRIQKLITDSPNDLNQHCDQSCIRLQMTSNPCSIKNSQTFLFFLVLAK